MAKKAANYEQIMAMFQELAEEHKRMNQEADRRAQEADRRAQEAAQEAEKRAQEAERRAQELDKRLEKMAGNLGGLNRSMGELIETLIAARLWEKFSAYPYNLGRAYQRVPVYDEKNIALTDIDILLSDTEWVMAVEVKREPDKEDIEHHIRRMGRILKYPPAEVKGKKLLGAIAGGVVTPDIREQAYNAGFFVLELTGESVTLLAPPEGFTPKIW